MLENEYYKISIEEIEKYIIMKKIKDMSLEEIKNWIESQSQLIIIKDCIIEKKDNEIEKLNDIINKAKKCLIKYKKTNIEDYKIIIEFYKEMKEILYKK